jgi:hypothetical protein
MSVHLNHHVLGLAAASALLSAAPGAALASVPASGDPALYWNQVLATGLAGPPVIQSRGFAMVSTAIHEAVNATTGFQDYRFVPGVQTSGGDTRAATAVAAYNVLVAVNPAKAADYAAARDASLALVPDGAAKTAGMATGAAIATATLALRANDGATAVSTYSPTPGIGNWQPTPPGLGQAVAPQWGDVTPWVTASGEQFRPPPPPNIGSLEYATAYNEVMSVGAANSATRTADQTAAALYWAGVLPTQWVQAGLSVAETSGLSTLENARLFALLNTSLADTFIGVWDSKFEYDLWRPITAIHNDDGNPLTALDVTWTPLLNTPPYPSYISGLSGVNGASSTVLASLLGDAHSFCMTTAATGTRCWGSFSEAASEGANSRMWGGIHFRFDDDAGLLLGQQVAGYVLSTHAFDAAPEPAAWAMMILGFGLSGALLRRGRRPLTV